MSEAVRNEEVEDVLSSIRRLVSEDKRPLAGLSAAPRAPEPVPQDEEASAQPAEETPDRLVLTPALRVHAEDETGAADGMAAGNVDTPEAPLDLGQVARATWIAPVRSEEAEAPDEGPLVLRHSAAETEALVQGALAAEDLMGEAYFAREGSAARMAPEPEMSDDQADEEAGLAPRADPDTDPDALWDVEPSPHDPSYEAALHDEIETEVADDDSSPEDDDYTHDRYWEADDPEADPVSEGDQQEADGGHSHTEAEDEVEDAQDADADFSAPLADEAQDMLTAQAAQSMPETDRTSAVLLTAKIAALEAAASEIAHAWEPNGDEIDELAQQTTEAMAWEDDIELDGTGTPVAEIDAQEEAAEDPVAAAASPRAGEEQLMDEETLRALVSQIVRDELQGALGERITRNVRKLVRREIHRALTAQELE